MKLTFSGVILTAALTISASEACEPLQKTYQLSDEQVEVMNRSYRFGHEYDYGYTMAAISYAESSAGMNPENPSDPSGGVFHILLSHVLKRFDMDNTPDNRELAMNMLVNNFDFAAQMALEELQYWDKVHRGDIFRTWRSYNGGFYNRSKTASVNSMAYANKIKKLVSFLERNCKHWETRRENDT